MWGNFRTGPEVRHEFVLRPEPDVDSRRRRKPRSGRGLLPRTAARCSLGRRKQQVGPHAETGAQPLHHRHAQPLVPVQDFADGGVASSSRTLLEPEMLRPARDQGVCDGCPMAARLRHQRRLLEFRLRRLSGRGAETTEGPGLTRCGLRVSVPQRRTLWPTAANGYFCNPCRLAGNRMQFVRLNAAHTVACTAHSPPILTVS